MSKRYRFKGDLFLAAAEAAWVFVALPSRVSDEILDVVPRSAGFGSVRVAAGIGATEWNTSLFPSKEHGTYILPIKRAVRDQEEVDTGDTVEVTLRLVLE